MNTKLFYKMMARFYDVIDVIYFRDYEKSPRRVVLEAVKNGDRVLDLCTGTATNAMRIAKERPGARVVGVDLSKDMLRVASGKRKKEQLKNMKLYHMDATNMKFRDECFDKVLVSLVLHEVEEELADKLLREAKRVLKEDGELIVTEWERSKRLSQKAVFLPISVLEPKPFRTFIDFDLGEYFKKHGFEVVSEIHCDYSRVLRLKNSGLLRK